MSAWSLVSLSGPTLKTRCSVLKIRVSAAVAESRSINTRNGSMTLVSQPASVALPNGEVRNIRVPLRNGRAPYGPGEYSVADSSYGVSEYGDLIITRELELAPLSSGK